NNIIYDLHFHTYKGTIVLYEIHYVKRIYTPFEEKVEGMTSMPQTTIVQRKKAYALLKEDAEKILRLIEVQIDNLMTPQCPLYEEVLDTHMYGLSREIDFAVRLELISETDGRKLLDNLERKLNILHESAQNTIRLSKYKDI